MSGDCLCENTQLRVERHGFGMPCARASQQFVGAHGRMSLTTYKTFSMGVQIESDQPYLPKLRIWPAGRQPVRLLLLENRPEIVSQISLYIQQHTRDKIG